MKKETYVEIWYLFTTEIHEQMVPFSWSLDNMDKIKKHGYTW